MPKRSTSRKSSPKVVARAVSRRTNVPSVFTRAFWKTPRMLLVIALVALLGGYLLYKSFALTNTVTYSGSFTKKKTSVSYSVNATADGTLTAVASYANTSGFRMELLAADGHATTASLSGVNPQTMTVPVTKGSYALVLHGLPASKGSGSYTVTISYPIADTVPPGANITSPSSGTTIKGLTNIEGTATDNDGVAKVEVSVDGGMYTAANFTGTSSTKQAWSYLLDTTKLGNANHTVTARVADLTGNTVTTTATYTVNNAGAVTDTTPPTLVISVPQSGSTVSETTTFQGSASDNNAVAKVEYQVDGGSWSLASGTTVWSFNIDTTHLSNTNHTIAVRATDSAGNVGTASEMVLVNNATYTSTAPTTQGTWVSPEGVTISVNTVNTYLNTGQLWTIADVYQLLLANTRDLNVIGPRYTINVQDIYASQTNTAYQLSSTGVTSNWHANSWLKATPTTTFSQGPDYVFTHEFGHAWSDYWEAMVHQGDWTPYLTTRLDGTTYNGVTYQYLGQDPRLDSTQTWNKAEIIADDYRLLFGSAPAISERPYNINSAVVDPRNQPGLKDWLLNTWR